MKQFCMGESIRQHRKRLGLTQKQLAEKICVTPQNISKWEKDLSCPGVFMLATLSECFGVSMDDLVGRSRAKDEKLFIAVNGGGTKTEFCLFSQSGKIYKQIVLGGTNPNSVGIENTKQVLSVGLSRLLSEESNICSVYAGIAGCGSEKWRDAVQNHIKTLCPYSRVDVETDIPGVIAEAPIGGNFITVICGTGFVIYAKCGEVLQKYGGFGYRFDDGLCGYTLGREAITETLAVESGLSQSSLVSKLVETKLGAKASDSIGKLYSEGTDYIASFARGVFDAYDMGDAKAAAIIAKLAKNTGVLLEKASDACGGGNKVVISGGLVAGKDVVQKFLNEATDGRFRFYFVELPQICGSVIRGMELYDQRLADNTFKNKVIAEMGGKNK